MNARTDTALIFNAEQAAALEDALLEAGQQLAAFEALAIDDNGNGNTPPWLFVMRQQFDRLHSAAYAYMHAQQTTNKELV